MGNTLSGEEDTQKTMYNKYIQQQQQQIQQQQNKINQLLQQKQSPNLPVQVNRQRRYSQERQQQRRQQQQQHQPHQQQHQPRHEQQQQHHGHHPSQSNVRRVPNSAKTHMNPYNILGIDKNYTEESLKKAYIRKAVKTHPDKGGDKDAFQQVTIAYTLLLKKLGEKDSDRQHYELKRGHEDYRESGSTQMKQNVQYSKSKGTMGGNDQFDANLFNKIYDDNRLGNVDDDGYGNWIKKNAMGENCEDNPKLFNGNFNKNMFHSVFNEHKQNNMQRNKNKIIEYEEPQALNSGGHELQVLGKGRVKDFSSAEVLGNGVKYRDYKDAYTNSTLIDINSVNIGDRKRDIKSYQAQRSNVRHQMNADEEAQQRRILENREKEESRRLRNLDKDDRRVTDHYERVHKLLIRN